MTPSYVAPRFTLYAGDSLAVLPTLAASSVDSVVSDPPYGLSFMGKEWDHGVPGEPFWRETLRVAKPGAHLLAFGGTRTFHRLAVAIEDAGWEIRDTVMWVYGSGFPKSLDVSKAIDKAAGARGHEGHNMRTDNGIGTASYRATVDPRKYVRPLPATDAAKAWAGWGTALKPAWEPIIVARKPLEGTVAANVLQHGTGAMNIDGCRIDGAPPSVPHPIFNSPTGRTYGTKTGEGRNGLMSIASGRWPANFIHDGSEEPTSILGDAARFFYSPKADADDRNDGGIRNPHPTVKPTDLMRYLVRMVTPLGGVVLDPFMGSGSTGRGAIAEGCRFVGIDLSPEFVEIARARIEVLAGEPSMFDPVPTP